MMGKVLRNSSLNFMDVFSQDQLDSFATVALWLFIVFFPLGERLMANLLVSARSQQELVEAMIEREDFKIAHKKLALFHSMGTGVKWNEKSPFYEMIFFE